MLAQTFKTADELELPPRVHAALIEVLRGLEAGEYVHVDSWTVHRRIWQDRKPGTPREFNMATWGNFDCGTPACMGGWACREVMPYPITDTTQVADHTFLCTAKPGGERPIDQLFFPPHTLPPGINAVCSMGDITVEWAARCLRRYLETGVVDWEASARC